MPKVMPKKPLLPVEPARSNATDGAEAVPSGSGRSTSLSRRAVLTISAGAGLSVAAEQALAQSSWLEGLGFAPSVDRAHRPPRTRQRPPLDDLRSDYVPWRSDEMLGRMERAIEHYQHIVDRGGWPTIHGGRMLRLDDDDRRILAIKRRLGMSGDLRAPASYYRSTAFDEYLEQAVARFQQQFGLRVTGRVDRATLAQLAAPAHDRLNQLKLNYRRIYRLMERIEDRYVLVNAAAFQLEAVEKYEVELRHRVIVGKPDRQTPEIKATIKGLNFFPYWRVPESVAGLDLIPLLRKEPDYLEKQHIRAYDTKGKEIDTRHVDWTSADPKKIRFKQDPGPHNALGLVRIDMPNKEIVYMHDTPMKKLFNRRVRPFSAGCVRVQGVMDLVEWIARYEVGWEQPGRARQVVEAGQALDLTLTRPIPVYFTYITAWADASGRAVFRPDIYGRDGRADQLDDGDAAPASIALSP